MTSFQVSPLPYEEIGYDNCAIFNDELNMHKYALINNKYYLCKFDPSVKTNNVALNKHQREDLNLKINDNTNITFYKNIDNLIIKKLYCVIDKIISNKTIVKINILEKLKDIPISFPKQTFLSHEKIIIKTAIDEGEYGFINEETDIEVVCNSTSIVVINSCSNKMFKNNFDFSKMEVGGMDKELTEMFKRAFATRAVSNQACERLDIKHVKGILLYGPPGCGKTLIARMLSKCLNSVEPKIINGPELKNKYVGESEKNIRALFENAEKDQLNLGYNSPLHVIIFDEFDSIGCVRGSGSDSSNINDGLVNQLLSKIDGVNGLNNVLLIAMTNRKDMIDPALLRPGRFELHVEISLPDESGRLQILKIHTKKLYENKNISDSVNLDHIASITKNYTGAEIESLIGTAKAYAISEHIDVTKITKKLDVDNVIIMPNHIEEAFNNIKPSFGTNEQNIKNLYSFGIVHYSDKFTKSLNEINNNISEFIINRKKKFNLLLSGDSGVGKTALSAYITMNLKIPFIRYISNYDFIGKSENQKCVLIKKEFDEAQKTPLAAIIIDDIENIIEYNEFNCQFSNTILQSIISILKKTIENKIIFIITTNNLYLIEKMNIKPLFDCDYYMNDFYNDGDVFIKRQ